MGDGKNWLHLGESNSTIYQEAAPARFAQGRIGEFFMKKLFLFLIFNFLVVTVNAISPAG